MPKIPPTPPPGVDPEKWTAGWLAAASSCPNRECVRHRAEELDKQLEELL